MLSALVEGIYMERKPLFEFESGLWAELNIRIVGTRSAISFRNMLRNRNSKWVKTEVLEVLNTFMLNLSDIAGTTKDTGLS